MTAPRERGTATVQISGAQRSASRVGRLAREAPPAPVAVVARQGPRCGVNAEQNNTPQLTRWAAELVKTAAARGARRALVAAIASAGPALAPLHAALWK